MSVYVGEVRTSKVSATSLANMTVKELVALCKDRGIDVPPKPRKADLIAALEA